MKLCVYVTIATVALWGTTQAASLVKRKAPGPEEAHKRMPKVIAAFEEVENKYKTLRNILDNIKKLGYVGDKSLLEEELNDSATASSDGSVTAAPKKKKDPFGDLINMYDGEAHAQPKESSDSSSSGSSIDDAPVHPAVGLQEATSAPDSPSPDAGVPDAGAMAAAAAGMEVPVPNPKSIKNKLTAEQKYKIQLDMQGKLKQFEAELHQHQNNDIHRVGEIMQPVMLHRDGYNRIKRDTRRRQTLNLRRKRRARKPFVGGLGKLNDLCQRSKFRCNAIIRNGF